MHVVVRQTASYNTVDRLLGQAGDRVSEGVMWLGQKTQIAVKFSPEIGRHHQEKKCHLGQRTKEHDDALVQNEPLMWISTPEGQGLQARSFIQKWTWVACAEMSALLACRPLLTVYEYVPRPVDSPLVSAVRSKALRSLLHCRI